MADLINGLFVKKPHPNAPSFVKAKVSVKKEDFINWLHSQEGAWVNMDIKESRDGAFYAQIDEWKPEAKVTDEQAKTLQALREKPEEYPEDEINPEDIPF